MGIGRSGGPTQVRREHARGTGFNEVISILTLRLVILIERPSSGLFLDDRGKHPSHNWARLRNRGPDLYARPVRIATQVARLIDAYKTKWYMTIHREIFPPKAVVEAHISSRTRTAG